MMYDVCQKSNFHSMETGRIKPLVHATMKTKYSVVHRQMDVVPPEQAIINSLNYNMRFYINHIAKL